MSGIADKKQKRRKLRQPDLVITIQVPYMFVEERELHINVLADDKIVKKITEAEVAEVFAQGALIMCEKAQYSLNKATPVSVSESFSYKFAHLMNRLGGILKLDILQGIQRANKKIAIHDQVNKKDRLN